MHSTGSFLKTLCERIRTYINEPDVDAKYSDSYICKHIIGPCMADVISRLSLTTGAPIIFNLDITFQADVSTYYLPPCVQQVLRIITTNTNGDPILDALPRDIMHRNGAGWRLEGNPGALALVLPSSPTETQDVVVWYTTNGDYSPHFGDASITNLTTTPTAVLDLLPTLGVMDRRPNAYLGQVFRLLPSAVSPYEERRIKTHTYLNGAYTVTLERPFLHHSAPNTFPYEIAPPGSQSLYEAIAVWGAMKLGTAVRISETHQKSLAIQYKAALKTAGDNLTDIQGRVPKHYIKDTIDNYNSPNNWMTLH